MPSHVINAPCHQLRDLVPHVQFQHGQETTLDDIAAILAKHGKEIRDLSNSVAHVVKHIATKDDIANVEAGVARLQEQVNSIEAELKYGRYESRLGKLEEKVFGAPRR